MAQSDGTANTEQIKFGFKQLKNQTPLLITWVFRTEFILNKMFMYWVGSTKVFGNMRWDIQEVILVAVTIDLGTWAFARFFGIQKTDMENFAASKPPDQ